MECSSVRNRNDDKLALDSKGQGENFFEQLFISDVKDADDRTGEKEEDRMSSENSTNHINEG